MSVFRALYHHGTAYKSRPLTRRICTSTELGTLPDIEEEAERFGDFFLGDTGSVGRDRMWNTDFFLFLLPSKSRNWVGWCCSSKWYFCGCCLSTDDYLFERRYISKNIILCVYVKKSGVYVHICLQSHTPVFWFGARLDMKGLTKKALQKSRGNDWRGFWPVGGKRRGTLF